MLSGYTIYIIYGSIQHIHMGSRPIWGLSQIENGISRKIVQIQYIM